MTQIETLAELQRVDQRLRERRRAMEDARVRLAEIDADHRGQSAATASAQAAYTALATQQKSLEERIGALESKMKDRRMRISRIRNEKELGLLKREVDLAKDESTNLEAELEAVYKQVETAQKALAAAEEQFAAITTQRDQLAAELAEIETVTTRETAADATRRGELIKAVDDDLGRRYETILSRRDGLAVVPMHKGTCRGCHMNIPPQLAIQIQRNESVILCPSCQRIIYFDVETVTVSQES